MIPDSLFFVVMLTVLGGREVIFFQLVHPESSVAYVNGVYVRIEIKSPKIANFEPFFLVDIVILGFFSLFLFEKDVSCECDDTLYDCAVECPEYKGDKGEFY